MQKISILTFLSCTLGLLHLEAQYTVPYSTSSVQGSTIITNYYDPNAGPDVGPGLPPTPLENRFSGPLSTFGHEGSVIYPTASYAPTTVLGTPVTPVAVPQQPAAYPPQVIPAVAPRGPVILNPIPAQVAAPLPAHVEEPTYPYPGLLTKMHGRWIASEYLYDLPSDIGIVLEVIKPASRPIEVDTQKLRNEAVTLFLRSHFNPESLAIGEAPPLPFFHILVMVYPDEDKTSASISGRLFEEIKLARLPFNLPGTFQAITWEKSDLIITSTLQLNNQLGESIRDIVSEFLHDVQYFDAQKVKMESGFRVEGCPGVLPPREPPFYGGGYYNCP